MTSSKGSCAVTTPDVLRIVAIIDAFDDASGVSTSLIDDWRSSTDPNVLGALLHLFEVKSTNVLGTELLFSGAQDRGPSTGIAWVEEKPRQTDVQDSARDGKSASRRFPSPSGFNSMRYGAVSRSSVPKQGSVPNQGSRLLSGAHA